MLAGCVAISKSKRGPAASSRLEMKSTGTSLSGLTKSVGLMRLGGSASRYVELEGVVKIRTYRYLGSAADDIAKGDMGAKGSASGGTNPGGAPNSAPSSSNPSAPGNGKGGGP